MDKAKVFWSGRSQAVRLPMKFRFDAEEVSIRKEGNTVVLEGRLAETKDEWAWLDEMPGELDEEFLKALDEAVPAPPESDALE